MTSSMVKGTQSCSAIYSDSMTWTCSREPALGESVVPIMICHSS